MTAEEFKQQAASLRQLMVSTAKGLLGDADEAEDIAQDAMLKLWLLHDSLTPPITGFASVVTRNLCIDFIRKRKPSIDINQLPEAEDLSDDGEQIEHMLQVIDSLPSAQRTILKMRHLEGMDMREIAMVMGSTEVAVRKTLSRARSAVRRKMIAWLAAAVLLITVSILTVREVMLERDDECVAYIYGQKYTDQETVVAEMKRTMGDMVADNPQNEIEQQLNDLFGD